MSVEFAVIGPGKIADRHLVPALRRVKGARLRSVLSRDPERGLVFARKHGATGDDPAPATLAALLDDPKLDAVLIASPDGLHVRQAIAAAEAGKHVLVEKPMATEVEGARRMVEACERNGVQLGVAYHLRWHAGHRELVRRVRDGELGEIRHVRVQWTWKAEDNTNWRAHEDVGRWWSLGGVGTHCLDLARWILVPGCGEPTSVSTTVTRAVHRGPHDETALIDLAFATGATASVCSSVLFEGPTRLEIYGSRDCAICEDTLGAHGRGRIRIGRRELAFAPVDPYEGEIADFVDAVRKNRTPEVDGTEGLRNVEILSAAVESRA